MLTRCKAQDLTAGMNVVRTDGEIMTVVSVVVGSKGRFGMCTIRLKPLFAATAGTKETQIQARPDDVFTRAE